MVKNGKREVKFGKNGKIGRAPDPDTTCRDCQKFVTCHFWRGSGRGKWQFGLFSRRRLEAVRGSVTVPTTIFLPFLPLKENKKF